MRVQSFDFVAAVSLCALCSVTVLAAEPVEFVQEEVAAIATDAPAVPSPEAVAREVIRLQEELGGSIAAQFGRVPMLEKVPGKDRLWHVREDIGDRPQQESPVVALRAVSWQLEKSAHRLELLDLYDQADALREAAAMIREEARLRKQNGNSTRSK